MTATPTSKTGSSRMLSRRAMLQGAAGLGAVAIGGPGPTAGGHANAVQFDTEPLPTQDTKSTPVTGETVASVAARLAYDQDAIFAFVRDGIRYETYAGILRGAHGTLWARAGNSADQALLLAELLAASQLPYRFAIGQLEPDGQAELMVEGQSSRERLQATYDAKTAAAYGFDPSHPEPPPTQPSAEMDAMQAELQVSVEKMRTTVSTWFDETASQIAGALDDAGVVLPPMAGYALDPLEITQHAWLQVPDGPAWIDLDPSFPGSTQSRPQAEPTETMESLPAEWSHTVRFRIVAEEVIDGKPRRRDAVTREFTSDQLINVPVSFMVAPSDELAELGQSITTLFAGSLNVNPIIVHGTNSELGKTSVVFQSSEESVLGLFEEDDPAGEPGPGEGETLALWYAVDVLSPGAAPITVERTWFDRFDPEARLQPELDLGHIRPLELIAGPNGITLPSGLERISMLSVDVARLPMQLAMNDQATADTFELSNLVGPTYTTLREAIGMDIDWAYGTTSWIGSPQVTAFTFRPDDPAAETSPLRVDADLMIHTPQVMAFAPTTAGPTGDVHPGIRAGILDQLAERLVLDPTILSRGAEAERSAAGITPSLHVGAVFAAAAAGGIPIRALTSPADLAGFTLAATTTAAMQEALDGGFVVVCPEQDVEIDGERRFGWWVIDPESGATRDQMDNGAGSVSTQLPVEVTALFVTSAEYISQQIQKLWTWMRASKCFQAHVGVAFAWGSLFFIDGRAEQTYAMAGWAIASTFAFATSCGPGA